jgi:hypothetical protein
MGMTLWIQTLQGRTMSKGSDDHSLMLEHADALDELARQIGVPTMSSFFDSTEIDHIFLDGEEEEEDEDMGDQRVDPETGAAYGIDDMKWFDSAQGIASLTALRSHMDIPRKELK